MTDTTSSLNDLLADMRVQVQWSDKATMPIPLYERMKAVILAMGEVTREKPQYGGTHWQGSQQAGSNRLHGSDKQIPEIPEIPEAAHGDGCLVQQGDALPSPANTDTLIQKLEAANRDFADDKIAYAEPDNVTVDAAELYSYACHFQGIANEAVQALKARSEISLPKRKYRTLDEVEIEYYTNHPEEIPMLTHKIIELEDEIEQLQRRLNGQITDAVTVRSVIDDRPWIAGEGVKFNLRYLEYENDELGISTGTIDIHDVVVSPPAQEVQVPELPKQEKWEDHLMRPLMDSPENNAVLKAATDIVSAFNKSIGSMKIIAVHERSQAMEAMADALKFYLPVHEITDNDDFDIEKAKKDLKPDAWELLKQPVVQSLLYDINLLPEQITTSKHWFYMLSVLSHMDNALKREQCEIHYNADALKAARTLGIKQLGEKVGGHIEDIIACYIEALPKRESVDEKRLGIWEVAEIFQAPMLKKQKIFIHGIEAWKEAVIEGLSALSSAGVKITKIEDGAGK